MQKNAAKSSLIPKTWLEFQQGKKYSFLK